MSKHLRKYEDNQVDHFFIWNDVKILHRENSLKGGNRFRLLKKSNFFLCHKLLVKLSKNMFPKFQ